ncbi:MAG: hypothetical protein U5O16_00080 [Rhodococcus sp. (in: high G+C Gram-positive bacteria)]|uniref:hypothetical protein n=1 Tax=Rhodococcus sp. TaxID=1831 RepID=UPI002AD5C7D1|nr:hypothetical protein [Rhodococcus sp. (in: high G+C Gram-positive bacteria)]
MAHWIKNESAQRWVQTLALVFIVIVTGPDIIGSVTADPTPLDWVRLLALTIVVVGWAVSIYWAWVRYRHPERAAPPVRRISQDDVLDEDIQSVVNRSRKRIEAIKQLRVLYPGLNLRDAKELVDRHSEAS